MGALLGRTKTVRERDCPLLAANVRLMDQSNFNNYKAGRRHRCHTSEDKEEVARPLAIALRDAGLSVWYDEFELRIGDSLRRKIDQGLANSRFGAVVLSRAFFGRGWPEYELDGLVTRAVAGEQVLLPVWHDGTKRQVMDYSSSLADRLARSTATHTVEEIAAGIVIPESATLPRPAAPDRTWFPQRLRRKNVRIVRR